MPMVPSCFFSSLVDDIARLLPKRLLIPQSLLRCRWDQLIDGVPPSSCIVQCAEDPFYFTDWNANVAWMLCGQSVQQCQNVQDYLAIPGNAYSMLVGTEMAATLERAIYRSRLIQQSSDLNIADGFGWCNLLTVYQLIPIALLAFFGLSSIPLLLAVVVKSLVGLLRTGISAYAMSHA
jgi:hypothetical protein